jgi:phosphatidylglycerophosphatase A
VTEQPSLKTLRDPVHFIAFGFGAGLVPRAPGTAGSVVGLVAAWLQLGLPLTAQIAVVAVAIVSGIYVCGESARRLGAHDHPGIVFDEITGVMLAALVVPVRSFAWFALLFVLFRIFDIAKPWPIRDVDHRLGGGLGIMLDDVMAAVFAAACLLAIRVLVPTI